MLATFVETHVHHSTKQRGLAHTESIREPHVGQGGQQKSAKVADEDDRDDGVRDRIMVLNAQQQGSSASITPAYVQDVVISSTCDRTDTKRVNLPAVNNAR
jgi:hypothetical protein